MASQQRKQAGSLCSRFGIIAIEHGFITREQLMLALDEQVEDNLAGRPHRVLGAICFTNGWMTPDQIDTVLNAMFKARVERGGSKTRQRHASS